VKDDLEAVRKNTDTIPQINEELKAVRKTTDATLGDKGHEGKHSTRVCHGFQASAIRCQGAKGTPGDALSAAKNPKSSIDSNRAQIQP